MSRISLADKLKDLKMGITAPAARDGKDPVWGGPHGEGPNCGVTYSLLSRFLADRERFRLMVVEGLKPADAFNHRLHYGSMWHICEQYYSQGQSWEKALLAYARHLCSCYRNQQNQVDHWYRVCRAQFPFYIRHWEDHYDSSKKYRVAQEEIFNIPYALPSGRMVNLRGKWDGVDLIPHSEGGDEYREVWLFETKTKGDIKPAQIHKQLTFDLQTMLYVVALDEYYKRLVETEDNISYYIQGILYNAIRRPLSGGKGTIVRHKGRNGKAEETKEHFYNRLAEYIKDNPEWYFMRWSVNLHPTDINKFVHQCLNPILEHLCDWWEWIKCNTGDPFRPHPPKGKEKEDENMQLCIPHAMHWRHPYGVWNPLDEGGSTSYDDHLESGSEEGLTRVDNLFPELDVSESF